MTELNPLLNLKTEKLTQFVPKIIIHKNHYKSFFVNNGFQEFNNLLGEKNCNNKTIKSYKSSNFLALFTEADEDKYIFKLYPLKSSALNEKCFKVTPDYDGTILLVVNLSNYDRNLHTYLIESILKAYFDRLFNIDINDYSISEQDNTSIYKIFVY